MSSKANVWIQGNVSLPFKRISLPVKKQNRKAKADFEAFPCIRMEASYMVEFAVALPFFAGLMAVFLFFFQLLMVQQEVGNALLATGRELSVLACGEEEAGIETLTARVVFQKELTKDSAATDFVKGGVSGISLSRSEFAGNYICLKVDYRMQLPFGLFGRQGIALTQKMTCRKWTGDAASSGEDDTIVYITQKGSVYHVKRDCTYLSPSIQEIRVSRILEVRNRNGAKYYACEKCGGQALSQVVYITEYGNRYHSNKACSKIKRAAIAIHLSEVGGRRACSKCGRE